MADQASVSGVRGVNGRGANGGPAGVVSSLAEFGNDVATLAELQAKLASIDLKESAGRAAIPMALGAVGAVVGLGAVPVVLLGIGELLASALSIQRGWSYVLVAVVAMALAGGAALYAYSGLRHSLESFRRSREELVRNVSWIRTVLVHSGRSRR